MVKIAAVGVVLVALPLLAVFGLVIVGRRRIGQRAAAGHATFNPSDEALDDIPAALINLYTNAATGCIRLPWQVLAAVAKVESNHGRHGGATISGTGDVRPRIIGIALNGTSGTATIADTDNGHFDEDSVWDRAVGPFQFIPSSWTLFGRDANGDGLADPHNIIDAASAAVRHLCPSGTITDFEAALFSYNHSTAYVETVLDWARRYTGPLTSIGSVVEGYTLPLPAAYATEALVVRSHHDYPAWDAVTPLGTLAYAVVAGTITSAIGDAGIYTSGALGRCGKTIVLSGLDGATYTYCHLAAVTVAPGQHVAAGSLLGLTGGEPGTPGAGNTTGPHLHFAIRAYGQSVCPQPLLLAIVRSMPIPPAAGPSTGCVTPGGGDGVVHMARFDHTDLRERQTK